MIVRSISGTVDEQHLLHVLSPDNNLEPDDGQKLTPSLRCRSGRTRETPNGVSVSKCIMAERNPALRAGADGGLQELYNPGSSRRLRVSLAGPTVRKFRYIPSLSGLLSTRSGRLTRPGCPQLQPLSCDGAVRVSHSHADSQHLVAHGLPFPSEDPWPLRLAAVEAGNGGMAVRDAAFCCDALSSHRRMAVGTTDRNCRLLLEHEGQTL
jgi:hypothetical protein